MLLEVKVGIALRGGAGVADIANHVPSYDITGKRPDVAIEVGVIPTRSISALQVERVAAKLIGIFFYETTNHRNERASRKVLQRDGIVREDVVPRVGMVTTRRAEIVGEEDPTTGQIADGENHLSRGSLAEMRLSPRRFPRSRFVAALTKEEKHDYLIAADASDLLEVAFQQVEDETRALKNTFKKKAPHDRIR